MSSRERHARGSIDVIALSALALVSACSPRGSSEDATRQPVAGTVGAIEERYSEAADAKTRYEDCMTQFFPNYRELVEQYGEVYLGDEESGTRVSPALEGCRTEREESLRLQRLALGYEE